MWRKLSYLFDEADGVMITSAPNLRYFTGFAGGEGVCLVGKDFKYLFVDSRYTVAARLEAADFEVVEFKGGKLADEMQTRLKKHCVNELLFEDRALCVEEFNRYNDKFEGVELKGLSNELKKLRMVKTEEEKADMRVAESIGDKAFEHILPYIKEGVSENDIAAEIEYRMRRHGSEKTSFDTIVVSGVKSSMPHGIPSGKLLEAGDFVTMDFGCIYNGYCSDMTRTVAVGKVSAKQKEIYDTVLKAQLEGLNTIKAGIKGCVADKSARKVIEDAGYGECFGHSLGHGVGLEIHELPNLSPASDILLCKDMVVTCEPGIYVEGFGGVRIEDMVIVTENGVENLAASNKELIICG